MYYSESMAQMAEAMKSVASCEGQNAPQCGSVVVANRHTIQSEIEKSTSYVLQIMAFGLSDQVEVLNLDFSRLKNRKAVILSAIGGSWFAKDALKLESLINRSMVTLSNFASGNVARSELITMLQSRTRLGPDYHYAVLIDSGPKSGELIDTFLSVSPIFLKQDFHVKATFLLADFIYPPELLKAGYAVALLYGFSMSSRGYSFQDLALVVSTESDLPEMLNGDILYIIGYKDKWVIGGTPVQKSQYTGHLSILFYGDRDVRIYLKPSAKSELLPINISVQRNVQLFPLLYEDGAQAKTLADPKLIVEFDREWDTLVENKPEIIFEAASESDIQFAADPPMNLHITKAKISDRPALLPPDIEEKSSGLSTGVIVAIVIAVVVVVAIAGFCVYWFVIRPSSQKAQVANGPNP
jgi:hypothetical protein